MAKKIKKATKAELKHDPVKEFFFKAIAEIRNFAKTKIFWYVLYGAGGVVLLFVASIIYKNATKPRLSADADFLLLKTIVGITQQDTTQVPTMIKELTTKYRTTTAGIKAFYYAGVYYQKLGDNKTAVSYYKKFLGSQNNDKLLKCFTYAGMADIYVDMNKFNTAISYLKKATKMAPNDPLKAYYYYKTAKAYNLKGDLKKSKEMLENFEKKFPKSAILSTVKEELQFLKGQLGEGL